MTCRKSMVEIYRAAVCRIEDNAFIAAAEACFRACGIDAPCAVNLTITNDKGIQHINRGWRGIDAATDVLSFPSLPVNPGNLFSQHGAGSVNAWDSDSGAYFLGDVIISVDRAQSQALEYGHPLFREMTYLFVHGVCHLLGYDHVSKEDKQRMREQEEAALQGAFQTPLGDEELITAARKARDFAYVPYSDYRVGAALKTADGQVFTGCNVENASFGLTNCAERTAVFKAVSAGITKFDTIAITAGKTAPWPCGACRQVLAEFAPDLRVLIAWDEGKTASSTLQSLLPHSFVDFQEDADD